MPSKIAFAAALALATVVPATAPSAHHSFAMFDSEQQVWLEGTVTQFQWTNPHTFIQLSVESGGRTQVWSLEGGSPNILSRNGWRRTVLRPGDEVRVLINPLRNGRPGGAFLEVRKEDGSVYYYHG